MAKFGSIASALLTLGDGLLAAPGDTQDGAQALVSASIFGGQRQRLSRGGLRGGETRMDVVGAKSRCNEEVDIRHRDQRADVVRIAPKHPTKETARPRQILKRSLLVLQARPCKTRSKKLGLAAFSERLASARMSSVLS